MKTFTLVMLITSVCIQSVAQNSFPKEEFQARREKLFEQIGNGVALVWGSSPSKNPVKFRQSPDLYYLTGNEDPNVILIMVGKSKGVYLFSKQTTDSEVRWLGPSAWQIKDIKEECGIDDLLPYNDFWTYLSAFSNKAGMIYLPLTSPDLIEQDRLEMNYFELDLLNHPIETIPFWKSAISRIGEIIPSVTLKNINPLIDKLRLIKSPYEIEQLKISGRIGAEGVKEAIKDTKPGMYEYELEATATYFYVKRGARGDAFTAIVASGPNTNTIHYFDNDRQMKKEDFVLMDYGCDYNYYTSDITRVWPVSGKFSENEEKMYLGLYDVRNSIINAMKPGVSFKSLREIAYKTFKKHGFENKELSWNGYIGHFIGISVHDVGSPYGDDKVLQSGMVFNVEPVLDDPEKKIHMRLEDTILITDNGAVNLTESVPAELSEIYKLMKQKGLSGN